MFGRGMTALKTGFSVIFDAVGLLAVLAAAWLMPYMLELMVRVAGAS